jgi:hypothetical protein
MLPMASRIAYRPFILVCDRNASPLGIDSIEHRLVEPVQVIIVYLRLVCIVRLRFLKRAAGNESTPC